MRALITCVGIFLGNLTVLAETAPEFTSMPVETGTYGAAYSYMITTIDAENDLRVISVSSGVLPAGLTLTDNLDGTAELSGIPQQTGLFIFNLAVTAIDGTTEQTVNLDIAKEVLTVSVSNESRVYGDLNPAFEVLYEGFVNGDTEEDIDVPATVSTLADETSITGDYTLMVSGADDDQYTFLYQPGILTITKATLIATANNTSRIYGNSNPLFTIAYSGFKNGETPAVIDVLATASSLADPTSDVGAYAITPSGGSDGNYDFLYQAGTLTITKALLMAVADDISRPYGSANPVLTISYSGFKNGETAIVIDTPPTASTLADETSPLGDYSIDLSGGSDINYNFSFQSGTLTVTKALVTVTVANESRTYGTANPAFVVGYTGFVNGEDETVLDVLASASTVADEQSNVGIYTIELSGASDEAYDFEYLPGSLTITKALLTATADNASRAYGSGNPLFTVSYSGFVNEEAEEVIDVPVTASTLADEGTVPGTYDIVPTGGSDNNYDFIYQSGSLTITKALITATADNRSKVYGMVNPAFTVSYTGFVNGETETVLDVPAVASTLADETSHVGNYAITPSGAFDSNYDFDYVNGELVITKAILIATPQNESRPYNTPNPMFTVLYSGFVNGDLAVDLDQEPLPGTVASQTSDVGTYTISLTGGLDNNYTFILVTGTLTITQAIATVTVNNDSFTYDGAAKTASASTSPLGLNLVFTYGGSPAEPINAGIYGVIATVDELNYQGQGNGILTINQAPALVELSMLAQNFDGTPKSVTVSTVPLGLMTDVTYNGSPSAPTARASYTVEATVNETNYAGSAIGTLVINGPPTDTGIADVNVQEDAPNEFRNLYSSFSDEESTDDELIYTIEANTNPSLFTDVSIASGILTLDFAPDQFGMASLTIRATDPMDLFSEATFMVTVTAAQDDPVFTSSGVTGAVQGQLYQYMMTASDPDPGDLLSFSSLIALPGWLALNDNGDGTALLSGTPSNAEAGQTFGIALSVSDDKGNSQNQFFNITVTNSNDPPYFTSTPIETATEDVIYTYFINSDDDDVGDAVTISAPLLPGWLELTDNGDGTAQVSGTPGNADVGDNAVQIRVTDNSGAFANQDFVITVANVNDPPVITSSPLTMAEEDTPYLYTITSEDPDVGDVLELKALSKPTWLILNDNGDGTATLSGTPANQDVGSTSLVINVEDQSGANSNQNFTLTVTNTNDSPVFTSSPVTAALQDNVYSYTVTTSDPDGNDSRIIEATVLPVWLTLTDNNNGTATLEGTPGNGDLGSNSVTLRVTDLAGAFTEQSFTINVDNANDPPVFISSPVVLAIEDQPYMYAVNTADPDVGDTRTITALSIPVWLSLMDNGDGTGTLSGTPVNENVGNVSVVLNVKDALGANANQNFTLTVTNTNDPPVFQSVPVTSAVQAVSYSYSIAVDDPDAGDIVILSVTQKPAWLNFTDNGNGSGTLSGTPGNGDLGGHAVEILAEDQNGASVLQSFTVTVDNANDPPQFVSSPVLAATEDEAYTYNIVVSDPDIGDILDIQSLVLPTWLVLDDHGDGTALLSGTPLNTHVGIADVVLEVSDAQGVSVNQNFSITVSNTNDPPVFNSQPVTGAIQDQVYTYTIITADPDLGDARVITATTKPAWLTLTDNGNGSATLQGTPTNTNLGSNSVVLDVMDIAGAVTTQSFVINVDNANDPPSFTSIPVASGTEDLLYEYTITTTDPDVGDTRSITALSLPEWLTLTDNGDGTGQLAGTPSNDQVGNFTIVLNVKDAVGVNVNQNFTLTIVNTNDPPFFTSTPIPVAVQDLTYTYAITTGDPDVGDTRVVKATTLPTWLNFADHGDGTATLSGTPSNADLGSHQVVLNVEDEAGTAVDQVFTINVDNQNDPPSFTSTPVTSIFEDDSYRYQISTQDPDVGDIQRITALSKPAWLTLTDHGDGTATLAGTPLNSDVGTTDIVLNVEDGIGANVNQSFTITVTNTNDAPRFVSTPVTGAIQDVQYTYTVQTTDPDLGDNVSITTVSLPGWLTFTDNGDGTALLQGTPTNADLGAHLVTLTVTDLAGAAVNQVFTINVDNQNDAPFFTSSPVLQVNEDAVYTYNITTGDPDTGDTRSIDALSLSGWLQVSDNGDGTAVLQGIPSNDNVGVSNIVLEVTDALGSKANQSFAITVINTNDAPGFTSQAPLNAQQGILYMYTIETFDPDVGDTRMITSGGLPGWLMLNDNGDGTATLSGTPDNTNLGNYNIILTVEDAGGAASDQVFTVNVGNVNDPPVFISLPLTTIDEDELYRYTITADDPDTDDVLTIKALSKPGWLTLTDNGDGTGELSGTPLNNDVGSNEVVLNVEDKAGANVNQSFTIDVINTNDAPIIVSTPVTSAQQGLMYNYVISTTDPDVGDTRVITSNALKPWLSLVDNGDGTALLSGTPQNSDLGVEMIIINVMDVEGAGDQQSFELTIDDSNDPPVFESVPVITIEEDQFYTYDILVTDPDVGDMLDIVIINKPDWLTLTDAVDGTAVLSGVPQNQQVGDHAIELRATDLSGQTVPQNFTLTVLNTNDVPVFTSVAVTTATEDAPYLYDIVANDVDLGDDLTITGETVPPWLVLTDNNNGTARLQGIPLNEHVGLNNVTIRVTDVAGETAIQQFSITVTNTNDPPEIISTPVTSVDEDAPYLYSIMSSDPDVGDTFMFTSAGLPEWLVLEDSGDGTATLSGTPANADVGVVEIVLTLQDAAGSESVQTFDLTVLNTNDNPVLASMPPSDAIEDQPYTHIVEVDDPDVGDAVTLNSNLLPSWTSFTDNGDGTGTLTGIPLNEHVGNNTVVLEAEDNNGGLIVIELTIVVVNTNDPPSITSLPVTTTLEDDVYTYFITSTDPDVGDTFAYEANALPTWLTFMDNEDGTATITGTPLNEDVGSSTIAIRLIDAEGAVDEQSFDLEVLNTNDNPVFESLPTTKVAIGSAYTYQILVTDEDVGDVLSLSAPLLPSYLSLIDNGNGSGSLTGTIGQTANQDKDLTIRAEDSNGGAVQQSFTFTINAPPVISSFTIQTDEDASYGFTKTDFEANFSDTQGDVLQSIIIKTLPANGKLESNGVNVGPDDEILVTAISELTYVPDLNFFGSDSFNWRASDGISESEFSAQVNITVNSINDAPRLITSRQNDVLVPLEYSLGDPGIAIINSGELTIRDDDDDDQIEGATIRITQSFARGDLLSLPDEVIEITAQYDQTRGILALSGEATEAAYTLLLEQVTFSSPVGGEATLSDKQIEITVQDGHAESNVVSRVIRITEIFPELDIVNAFTPNNDGVNDTWDILNLQFYTDIQLRIYDPAGIEVFSCFEQECNWDGLYEGKELPAGPYFYTIDLNNGRRTYKGTVNILK